MACFLLPKSLCTKLEGIIVKFGKPTFAYLEERLVSKRTSRKRFMMEGWYGGSNFCLERSLDFG
ncbi:hypothetical protein EPI10_023266 [Gossypium australe]|uniref:Uncharacterized protein n=1 Tax=Gossypium australe TaxID=47621 RepID=A0A5B6VUT0_9ROSI|nr:hypothetical protein EPI10_023266 [Gossypium australe]